MPSRNPDRRIDRTRDALLQAFVGMLMADGFEAISVAAIAARADVGRSTFYTHFHGRDDILRVSLTMPSLPLARIVGHAVEPADLLPLIAHLQQNRRLARAFAGRSLREHWVRRLGELMEPDIRALSARLGTRMLLPVALVGSQLAETQTALVIHALASRSPVAPEALAAALIAVTRANLAALLQCDPSRLAHRLP